MTTEELDLRLHSARALIEDTWNYLRQCVREGWVWIFHVCWEIHTWLNQSFDAVHGYFTTWIVELRQNNETYANAEIVMTELVVNARENMHQLVVDLRECMGGPRHDTADEGVGRYPPGSSDGRSHEIDMQQGGEAGGTTRSYHSTTAASTDPSLTAGSGGNSSVDPDYFRRQ